MNDQNQVQQDAVSAVECFKLETQQGVAQSVVSIVQNNPEAMTSYLEAKAVPTVPFGKVPVGFAFSSGYENSTSNKTEEGEYIKTGNTSAILVYLNSSRTSDKILAYGTKYRFRKTAQVNPVSLRLVLATPEHQPTTKIRRVKGVSKAEVKRAIAGKKVKSRLTTLLQAASDGTPAAVAWPFPTAISVAAAAAEKAKQEVVNNIEAGFPSLTELPSAQSSLEAPVLTAAAVKSPKRTKK